MSYKSRISYTPEYTVGKLVGHIVTAEYLPTLETDPLKTNTVIRVTSEEKTKYEDLEEKYILYIEKSNAIDKNLAFDALLSFSTSLAKKYLPETLICKVPNFEITNYEQFRQGLRDYIWDTDLSWYDIPEDCLGEYLALSWYREVRLVLKVE